MICLSYIFQSTHQLGPPRLPVSLQPRSVPVQRHLRLSCLLHLFPYQLKTVTAREVTIILPHHRRRLPNRKMALRLARRNPAQARRHLRLFQRLRLSRASPQYRLDISIISLTNISVQHPS